MADERGEPQFASKSAPDDPNWANRSLPAEDLTPHFSFSLDRAVAQPSLGARNPLRPTAAEAIGHEPALAAYYREVMTLEARQPYPGDVGYWLRLNFISAAAGKEIGFPWWDRLSDASPFLTWIIEGDERDEFFDADQGWMLRAAHQNGRLHLQHSSLDTQEEFANLSVDRASFLDRLRLAEDKVRRVIAALRSELGVDPWS